MTADRIWPDRYGVVGDYVPLGFFRQLAFPFIGSTESRERSTLAPAQASWAPLQPSSEPSSEPAP